MLTNPPLPSLETMARMSKADQPEYREHYFPNKTIKEVRTHKNHCLDYLRQSVMCSGDVTLDHWFNYTLHGALIRPDIQPRTPPGPATFPRHRLAGRMVGSLPWMTGPERARNAPMMWDTVHHCRDYDSLYEWVKERQLVDEAYVAQFNQTEDVF